MSGTVPSRNPILGMLGIRMPAPQRRRRLNAQDLDRRSGPQVRADERMAQERAEAERLRQEQQDRDRERQNLANAQRAARDARRNAATQQQTHQQELDAQRQRAQQQQTDLLGRARGELTRQAQAAKQEIERQKIARMVAENSAKKDTSRIKLLEQSLVDCEAELQKVKAEYADCRQALDAAASQIKLFEQSLVECEAELEKVKAKCKEETRKLEIERNNCRSEIADLKVELRTLEDNLAECKRESHLKDAELAALKSQVRELQTQLQQDAKVHEETAVNAQNYYDREKEKNASLTSKVSNLEKTNKAKNTRIQNLTAKNRNMDADIRLLRSNNVTLNAKIVRRDNAVETHNAQLAGVKEQLARCTDQLARKDADTTAMQGAFESEITRLKVQLRKFERETTGLRVELRKRQVPVAPAPVAPPAPEPAAPAPQAPAPLPPAPEPAAPLPAPVAPPAPAPAPQASVDWVELFPPWVFAGRPEFNTDFNNHVFIDTLRVNLVKKLAEMMPVNTQEAKKSKKDFLELFGTKTPNMVVNAQLLAYKVSRYRAKAIELLHAAVDKRIPRYLSDKEKVRWLLTQLDDSISGPLVLAFDRANPLQTPFTFGLKPVLELRF